MSSSSPMSTGATTSANNTPATTTIVSSPLQAHAVRFGPGTDLVPALLRVAAQQQQRRHGDAAAACCVVTAVGSLQHVKLRMASARAGQHPNSIQYRTLEERVEIVSLVGTFAADGTKHLHMSVSRRDGTVVGGHLMEGTIFTTLELVVGTLPAASFTREMDADTGFDELVVRPVHGDDNGATATNEQPSI